MSPTVVLVFDGLNCIMLHPSLLQLFLQFFDKDRLFLEVGLPGFDLILQFFLLLAQKLNLSAVFG